MPLSNLEDPLALPSHLAAQSARTLGAPDVVATLSPFVHQRARNFEEALRQAEPLVTPDDPMLSHTASLVREVTARRTGLREETALALSTAARDPVSFAGGAQPQGACAEIVVARAFRDHHRGRPSGLLHAPAAAPNVVDVRLSPDTASARDLVFGIETADGLRLFRPGGQAKLGSPGYVTQSLLRMASLPGYGKTAYIDASLLDRGGAPRVGPDAFTEYQAAQLRGAGIRFRGVRNLDAQARALVEDLKSYAEDGLDPRARETLLTLREEIARAYEPGAIGARVASSAARSAATSAVYSLVVQLTSGGAVGLRSLATAAARGSVAAAGSVLADAAVFHLVLRGGLPEEAARATARAVVAGALCVVAVGLDVAGEIDATRRGGRSDADALAGIATSATLNGLALAVGTLGWPTVPVLLAAQLAGRWTLSRWRGGGRCLDQEFAGHQSEFASLKERTSTLRRRAAEAQRASAAVDEIFSRAMIGPAAMPATSR